MFTYFYDYALEGFNNHKSATSIEIVVDSNLTAQEIDPIINEAIEANKPDMYLFMLANNLRILGRG